MIQLPKFVKRLIFDIASLWFDFCNIINIKKTIRPLRYQRSKYPGKLFLTCCFFSSNQSDVIDVNIHIFVTVKVMDATTSVLQERGTIYCRTRA